ncbi:MAG: hypothetical protein CMF36_05875 [Leeuwenhoekiella sp.]|nr:hypothetical protein [Leeuwenhoekiella sp.]MBA80643.1 hypothetical protein [Leeuwenhoekiella sp.]
MFQSKAITNNLLLKKTRSFFVNVFTPGYFFCQIAKEAFKSMEILVFRTSIRTQKDIKAIARILNPHNQILTWSVDLEDWEHILRIEVVSGGIKNEILSRIRSLHFQCQELED